MHLGLSVARKSKKSPKAEKKLISRDPKEAPLLININYT